MRRNRALAVMLGAIVATGVLIFFYQRGPSGWFPECGFHRMTGLNCPGCGMTRATAAALHGRFGEAFRFNPLGMTVLPVVLVLMGMRIPAWLRDTPPRFRFSIGPRGVWWIIGVVLAYWVLRNLPVWPLTYLAPP